VESIIRRALPSDIDALLSLYREHLNAYNPDIPIDDRVRAH